MYRLDGKVAVVTGGATGIGFETCALFVRAGANVVLTDVDRTAGERAAAQLGAAAHFVAHDVRDDSQWSDVVATCRARFGALHVLVNNAGIVYRAGQFTPADITLEEWRAVGSINVEGVVLGCKHALAAMQGVGGSIVNVASIAALFASPLAYPYGAGKAAVVQLTKTVAVYAARRGDGIRCNAVLPGPVETALYREYFSEAQRAENARAIPIGRMGRPEELAVAIGFLASDAAAFITGAALAVDGGVSASNPLRGG